MRFNDPNSELFDFFFFCSRQTKSFYRGKLKQRIISWSLLIFFFLPYIITHTVLPAQPPWRVRRLCGAQPRGILHAYTRKRKRTHTYIHAHTRTLTNGVDAGEDLSNE